MRTKYIMSIAFAAMTLSLTTSCDDGLLDQSPLNSYSDDAVWGDLALSKIYLNAQYANLETENMKGTRYSNYTEEVYQKHLYGSETVTAGLLNCDTYSFGWDKTNFDAWGTIYGYIKSLNLMLEKIDNVPGDEAERNCQKGQALFLRAWNYHLLYSLYGRVPLVDKTFQLNDKFELKRAGLDEVADFICKDLDEAAALLPEKYDDSELGRATKGAALALKSRILLYKASPLFGTPSREKWQAAADAAKAVMDLGVYSLKSVSNSEDYGALFLDPTNPEVIFEKLYDPKYGAGENNSYMFQAPCGSGNGFEGWGNFDPSQEIVDKFQMADGTKPVLQDRYTSYPWGGREIRFNAAFILDGDKWGYGNSAREVETFIPAEDGVVTGKDSNQGESWWNASNTGYSMRKFLDPSYDNYGTTQHVTPWFFIRLAEIYLNYAECEIQLGNIDEAMTYINKVRTRALLPAATAANTEQAWDAYYYERQIELVFEGQHWFDLRRWKKMEECYSKPVTGVIIYKYRDGHKEYQTGNVVANRIFNGEAPAGAHYWMPVPRYELRRSNLIDGAPYE